MLLVFVLFWLLIVWGLKEGDIYTREAVTYGCIWAVLFGGFVLLPEAFVWFVVPLVLLDIVLLMKVMGTDILIR